MTESVKESCHGEVLSTVCVAWRAFSAATIERWAVLLGVAQGIPASADEEELRRLFVGTPIPPCSFEKQWSYCCGKVRVDVHLCVLLPCVASKVPSHAGDNHPPCSVLTGSALPVVGSIGLQCRPITSTLCCAKHGCGVSVCCGMQGGQASRRCAYPETLTEPVVGLLSWYVVPCTRILHHATMPQLMPSLLLSNCGQ